MSLGPNKNAGVGFESMGLPNRKDGAEQSIYADKEYGVQPKVGSTLRLQARGYSFLELPLPATRVRIPLRRFEKMAGVTDENLVQIGYLDRRYVEGRREEKASGSHQWELEPGVDKVTFFEGNKRWYPPGRAPAMGL